MPPISPGSMDSVVNQMNQNIAQQNTSQLVDIFKDETGTRRVLSGKGKNGFYGFKVSQPGIDVYEALDNQLIFNSDLNVFKYITNGTQTVTVAAGSYARGVTLGTAVIPHGLSTTPAFLLYVTMPNFGVIGPYLSNAPAYSYVDTGTNVFASTVSYGTIDSTNLTLRVVNLYSSITFGNAFTWTFKFYILQEIAAD